MTRPGGVNQRSGRRRVFSRGVILVLGLFALGGLALWGLFQAPRAISPPVTTFPATTPSTTTQGR